MKILRLLLEKRIFGVTSWWSQKLRIKSSWIRLLFIYAAFTQSMVILIYLLMLFILKLRNHYKFKRRSVFDL
ncbi:MAG: PspC family transcriptional regulator [Flavobacteriales bacterium]|nr:PspC family transcriptional regulator [Flavobacteriales bacterium]|tara:strand:+ start:1301 stop:1516 length:216 start_codon:yes stop_codon:yes gene_type:complete